MIVLVVVAVALFISLVTAVYLLGFRLGGSSTLEELTRVRAEAAQARRQMKALTRQAFVAMLDEARRHRQP